MAERERWPGIRIYLLHYYPRSKGARVMVFHFEPNGKTGRHIVSSASGEGMTVDDPNITLFLDWVKEHYEGAPVIEVTDKEEACRMFPEKPSKSGRRRTRKTEDA